MDKIYNISIQRKISCASDYYWKTEKLYSTRNIEIVNTLKEIFDDGDNYRVIIQEQDAQKRLLSNCEVIYEKSIYGANEESHSVKVYFNKAKIKKLYYVEFDGVLISNFCNEESAVNFADNIYKCLEKNIK